MKLTQDELISMVNGLKSGNEDSVNKLYEAFYNQTYYYFLKMTHGDEDLSFSLSQDTLLKVISSIYQLKEPIAFIKWMDRIRFTIFNDFRKSKKDFLVKEYENGWNILDDTLEESREEFIPDDALDQIELKRTILVMIDNLPDAQREAILMRYFEEISVEEIAEVQGVSEGTVKSRLNYGRKAIKQSVEEYEQKHGIKLHCAGVIPLLLWLFREYRIAKGISLTAKVTYTAFSAAEMATVTSGVTATAGATTTSTTSAIAVEGVKEGAKVGASALKAKIIAGTATAIAAGGVVVATVLSGGHTLDTGYDICAQIPDHVTKITFTDITVPDGIETIDLSFEDDGSIVAYIENNEMIITTPDGKDIYANENCHQMFQDHSNLEEIVFDNFDTSNTQNMSGMFLGCRSLKKLDLSGFDITNVSQVTCMFFKCFALEEIDLSTFKITSLVESFNGMFQECRSLTYIDLSDWDTSNVSDRSLMFDGCESLERVDVTNWETKGDDMFVKMFESCENVMIKYDEQWVTPDFIK